jgi:hypothetical protein
MKALMNQCPDMKLRDVIVPGTHDSASYTISSLQLFSAVGRTQNLSVQDQLLAGARYIDLRVANAKKRIGLSIWHGCLEGGAFMEVLEEVQEFLKNHEQEFVVLELVPEYGRPFARDARMDMLKSVHRQLGSRAVPADQVENLLSSWTLKDLAAYGKQVVVLLKTTFNSLKKKLPVPTTWPAPASGCMVSGITRGRLDSYLTGTWSLYKSMGRIKSNG